MADKIKENNQAVKSKNFIVASPYYHSFATAMLDKERDLNEHGDYTLRSKAYTKDFGPIKEKNDLEIVQPPVSVETSPSKKGIKKTKRDLEREKAEQEAKAKKAEKQRRIDEAKLKKRQEKIKKIKRKRRKKEKDYFFIMRKGVCFFMALVMIIMLALFGIGFVKMEALDKFTALYKNQDTTPLDERVETEDPESGDMIPYQDKSTYVGVMDPVAGFIKSLVGVSIGDSEFYDEQVVKLEAGVSDTIASLLLKWFPVALLLYALLALVSFIKAFFGMFGQRIYKRFGITSIAMIILAAITAFGGYCSLIGAEEALNYSGIMPFIIQLFAAPVDGQGALVTVAGYGLLGLVGLPLVTLFLSFGIRKKIPYSVFD